MNSNTVAALITRGKIGEDGYGNDVYGETVQTLPAIWWPDSSTESTDGRDQVTWQATVCLPTGTVVEAVDAVVPQVRVDTEGQPVLDDAGHVQGDRYEVDGPPAAYPPNPHSGWQHPFSAVLTLKRTTG